MVGLVVKFGCDNSEGTIWKGHFNGGGLKVVSEFEDSCGIV